MANLMEKQGKLEAEKWQKLEDLADAVINDEVKEADRILNEIRKIEKKIGEVDLQFDYQANDLAKERMLRS